MFDLAGAGSLQTFLDAVDWLSVGERLIYSGGGFIVALVGAYLVLARDVAYIKGKVDLVTDNRREVEQVRIDVATIRAEVTIIRSDLAIRHAEASAIPN